MVLLGQMLMREEFQRGEELARESRMLPAPIYNSTRLLLRSCDRDCVFVPIRTMQYQAVIDAEEIIFVDGLRPRMVEVAWREFRPQARRSLDQAVPYQLVLYHPKAQETMTRLQSEFAAALFQQERRLKATKCAGPGAQIIGFDRE